MVVKGGIIAWSQMGDPNASIPTPQPVYMPDVRQPWQRRARVLSPSSVQLRCQRQAQYMDDLVPEAVRNCRTIGKRDMKLNDAIPKITVDPETYQVTADGELLEMRSDGGSAIGSAIQALF